MATLEEFLKGDRLISAEEFALFSDAIGPAELVEGKIKKIELNNKASAEVVAENHLRINAVVPRSRRSAGECLRGMLGFIRRGILITARGANMSL